MGVLTRSITVSADQAGRIDLVVQQLTGQSRRAVAGLFDAGCVSLNNQPCAQSFARVGPGDRVGVRYDAATRYHAKAQPWKSSAFRLVYEDEHLLVVDKAAWVLSEPTGKKPMGTLLDSVSDYLSRGGRRTRAHLIHRLDRGVSGLLIFGKSSLAAGRLKLQFSAHLPQRQYVALVAGEVKPHEGTFRSYLATAENLDRYSTPNEKKGELAITHYRVERVLEFSDSARSPNRQNAKCCLVRVRLETGQRNQIRVHFAEAGHPVLGDPRYQPDLAAHPRWRPGRLALHAAILRLTHPITGRHMHWESPLPSEFARFLA